MAQKASKLKQHEIHMDISPLLATVSPTSLYGEGINLTRKQLQKSRISRPSQ